MLISFVFLMNFSIKNTKILRGPNFYKLLIIKVLSSNS
jgi:hypothetical protein